MVDRGPRATDTDGLLLGDLAPGARVGEYVIERVLATRGTGHDYEAKHLVLPRRVTIKVIPAAQTSTRTVALDLLREACIVDALDHPGIPRIYECGLLADRRPWIATELIEGVSLAVQRDAPRTISEVVAIVRDVADILDHAHARSLVHHGVIPEAIVFPEPARRFPICLVHWSGARTRDSRAPLPMLAPKQVQPYLAPELGRGGDVDGRADVFSLGRIARELIARVTPDSRPPIFAALLERMLTPDPMRRPTAAIVRDHAAWIAEQFDHESGIPTAIDENDPTDELRAFVPVTSEDASEVEGEIDS